MSASNWNLQPLSTGDPWMRSYLEELRGQYERELRDAALAVVETLDDLDRLTAAGISSSAGAPSESLRIVRDRLRVRLDGLGLTPIPAVGQTVNPICHRVEEVVDEPGPPTTIVRELQTGYLFRERLLRPSLVVSTPQNSTTAEPH